MRPHTAGNKKRMATNLLVCAQMLPSLHRLDIAVHGAACVRADEDDDDDKPDERDAKCQKLYVDDAQTRAIDAVDRNPMALEHASAELRNNADVVRFALKKNGMALQHASEALRGDEGVVLAAMRENITGREPERGLALQFASEGLRNNKEVVLEAVGVN